MSQIRLQLEKLKETEEKAKTTIQAIQLEIDESAKVMATQNAELQKQKQELEIGKNVAFKSLEEKHRKEIDQLEEKYQKEISELEAKEWERNANFAKEMTSLKEQLKEKINWDQVDLVMGKKQPRAVVSLNPRLVSPIPYTNEKGNGWNSTNTKARIFPDGLRATTKDRQRWHYVFAKKGVSISGDGNYFRKSCLSQTILYFEVTKMSSSIRGFWVGLSNGSIPDGAHIHNVANCYAFLSGRDYCYLFGVKHPFEWPNGAIKPKWNDQGDVLGCGLFLNPAGNKLSIFFTGNGILMIKQIPINPTADYLFPTVTLWKNVCVEANFGDNPAKPFKYNIEKCPGLVLE